jgi:Protein of unknown function (DUF3592)
VKGKLIGTIFCVLIGLPFFLVGVWSLWSMGSTLYESWAARGWVMVHADVLAADLVASRGKSRSVRATGTYRYTFEGRDYTSSRLGIATAGGGDNIGSWQEEMADYLKSARKEKRTINVYVNPASPSEAVVDRKVRWPMMLFLSPFAFLFGGVGVGMLFAARYVVTRPAPGSPAALELERKKREKDLASAAPQRTLRSALATGRPASFYDPGETPEAVSSSIVAGETPETIDDDDVIPPHVATVETRGSRITLHYPAGLFSSLFGRITTTAGDGQLQVERTGIFGRKEFKVAQSAVTGIQPVLLYSVTSGGRRMKNYYALKATTREGERIPLSPGLPGEDVARAVALRIAKALKLAPEQIAAFKPPVGSSSN